MKKQTNKLNFVMASLLVASTMVGCSGGVCAPTDVSGIMISGLTFDQVSNAVYSVNNSGNLCKLDVKQIPNNIDCSLQMPNDTVIVSQVVSDGNGHVFAIGRQTNGSGNYILQYDTQTRLWSSNAINLPYLNSRNKLLYKNGNLYTSDPISKALYTINVANTSLQKTDNYFIESQAIVEDFIPNGGLVYSYLTNNLSSSTYRTNLATTVYNLASGGSASQVGDNGLYINDIVYANGNLYGCAESTFVYLQTNASPSAQWQILTNGSGYFSCDYVTTDNSNLYYVEGVWLNNSTFSNGYINKKSL